MEMCVFEILLEEDMLFRKGEILDNCKISVHIKNETNINFQISSFCDVKFIIKPMCFSKEAESLLERRCLD